MRAASPRKTSVEESLVLTLFDLANHLARHGERMAALGGLTLREWLVLLEISGDPHFRPGAAAAEDEGGVLASQIADRRGVARATVSVLVKELARRELIEKVEDAHDARRARLRITPAGQAALAAIEPARRRGNRRLLAPWSRESRARLAGELASMLERLNAGA